MRLRFGNPVINAVGYFFLRNCRHELHRRAFDAELVVARIRDHTQQVFDASVAAVPDPQTRVIHAYCSLVLATFWEIRAETGDAVSAYAFTRTVFQQTLERPLRLAIRVWLWFVRDPVRVLSRWSLAQLFQRSQGKSMEFAEEKTDGSVDLLVRQCAHHQFFVAHGEPALTPVLCIFDRTWMEALEQSSRPIRMERPSTISTGGDCCRFRFIRDHNKLGVEPVDIVLVQLQKTPYTVRENQTARGQ